MNLQEFSQAVQNNQINLVEHTQSVLEKIKKINQAHLENESQLELK